MELIIYYELDPYFNIQLSNKNRGVSILECN